MTPHGALEFADLERAIRSLGPLRAPAVLRSALRRDLLAAAARRSFGPASLIAPMPRLAFAALAVLLLATSGWALAASAPGDVVYPVKDAILRLVIGPRDELRAPLVPDVLGPPSATGAPLLPGPELVRPSTDPDRIGVPAAPILPEVQVPLATPVEPFGAPAAAVTPAGPEPASMAVPAPATSAGPARAIPAVPPDPPGPRATPAIPPRHE